MIKIIDDFFPEILFERLYETMTSFDFPWFYLKDTTYRSKYSDDTALWDDGFSCLIYINKEEENFEFKCPAYEHFLPLITHCEFVTGLKASQLSRVKANLSTTSISNEPFEPHIDQPNKQIITGLLCMNDSDGPTYIYENKCPVGFSSTQALEYYRMKKDEFKLMIAVPPKRNRMIIFPGEYYHSGSRPVTNKMRLNINFNWLAEPPIKI